MWQVMSQKPTIITCYWSTTLSHSTSTTKSSIATSVESSTESPLWQILWLVELLLLIKMWLRVLLWSILWLRMLHMLLVILHMIVLWFLLSELQLQLWYFCRSILFPFHKIHVLGSILDKCICSIVIFPHGQPFNKSCKINFLASTQPSKFIHIH